MAAESVRGVQAQRTGSDVMSDAVWVDLYPSSKAKRKSPVGIRKGMLEKMRAARDAGVATDGFRDLEWDRGFRHDKLRNAMRYLSNETGLTLQYQEPRGASAHPLRWRIKP